MFYFFAAICFWIVVFFPFAIWARRITRQDALTTTEAYMLGQSCGPVGVWLVMRENKKAEAKAYRAGLLVDHARMAPPQEMQETPGQIEKRLREQLPPQLNEMPGGLAYRGPQELRPPSKQTQMSHVGLRDPVRPGPAPKAETAPFEPPPPPATKAAIAWRPPPSGDPKFMHSDEKPEDARVHEKGDGNG